VFQCQWTTNSLAKRAADHDAPNFACDFHGTLILINVKGDSIVGELTQRMATLADMRAIWGLVRQVADNIPADLANEAVQENILTEIMACCTSGLTPIAVAKDKSVVGALLARRDTFDWGFLNGNAIHISFAAIAPEQNDQGVFAALISDIKERQATLFASVKNGDRFGIADQLQKLGFAHECTAANGWGDLYKWLPLH